jgi:hypothetical protein
MILLIKMKKNLYQKDDNPNKTIDYFKSVNFLFRLPPVFPTSSILST